MKKQDGSKKRGCAGTRIGRHGTLAVLLVAGLSGGFGVAYAEVPTAGDIAACNREAREGLREGMASPTSKDEAGADAARKARGVEPSGARAHVTQSPDPHVHGMDAVGAPDAAYRAAYRVCMRRSGF